MNPPELPEGVTLFPSVDWYDWYSTKLYVPMWSRFFYMQHPEWKKYLRSDPAKGGEGGIYFLSSIGGRDNPVTNSPVSGSLPICYINTVGNADVSKSTTEAQLSIDLSCGIVNGATGNLSRPLNCQIRMISNDFDWSYAKSSYSLTLENECSPFGLPASRYFALRSYPLSDSYLAAETAYELGRLIGLGWQRRSYPVEVVLNGENLGVYGFSETICVEKGRLEFEKQPDGNNNQQTIPYGWLVTIYGDYVGECYRKHFLSDEKYSFTCIIPSVTSSAQKTWLCDQLSELTTRLYHPLIEDSIWELLDLESFAKCFIMEDLRANVGGFLGRTYLYKDTSDKWKVGPLNETYLNFADRPRTGHFWEEGQARVEGITNVSSARLLKDLIIFPEFQEEVRKIWSEFYPEKFNEIYEFMNDFTALTEQAYETNRLVWPYYSSLPIFTPLKERVARNAEWFDRVVQTGNFGSVDIPIMENTVSSSPVWYTLQGVRLPSRPTAKGIYIECKGSERRKVAISGE